MENKSLEKDVLVTLLYNDVFDMPLTAFEVWRYRMHLGGTEEGEVVPSASLFEVNEALANLLQKNLLVRQSGMYVLPSREGLVTDRMYRMKRSDRKWRRFLHVARLMRLCPFVRMIAVTGRLATKQIGMNSDWDVLVVMQSGHIWMGRLLLTIFLHILGKRRWGSRTKDRVCLNHFLTTDALSVSLKDLFAAREYASLVPVFGWEVFWKFERENRWIQNSLPDWKPQSTPSLRLLSESPRAIWVQKLLEQLFGVQVFENWARNIQKQKIEKNPKTHLPGAYIVANDDALIFLPKPQGPRVFEKFMERLSLITHNS